MWGVPGWYICTPQWFARDGEKWKNVKPDIAIVDEIHMAAAWSNATRKALWNLEPTVARLGMSGTPFRNKFENAYGIINWIYPGHIEEDYWSWRIIKCKTKYDRFAPQNRVVIGELNPGELVGSLPCYIIHRQREECCSFHPEGFLAGLDEPERVEVDLSMTTEQRKFYRQMEDVAVAWLETPDPETGKVPVVAELPIQVRSMLRFAALGVPSFNEETEKLYFEEDCSSPKLDQLIQDVTELDGGRVLVAMRSQQFARVATKRLQDAGFTALEWSGKTTKKKRDQQMDAFLDGSLQVVVGVVSAMGTGTDGFQEVANTMIVVEVDEDPTNMSQLWSRLDRLGQKQRVLIIEYRMLGTIDEGITSKQIQKILLRNQELRAA